MNRRWFIVFFFVLSGGVWFSFSCDFLLAEVSLSTHQLEFVGYENEEILSQRFVADCSYGQSGSGGGYSGVRSSCDATVTSDQEWLLARPSEIYGQQEVIVSINHEGLKPGIYEGTVRVDYVLVSPDDEEDLHVKLTVNPNVPVNPKEFEGEKQTNDSETP